MGAAVRQEEQPIEGQGLTRDPGQRRDGRAARAVEFGQKPALAGETLSLDGLLFLPDGSAHWAVQRSGSVADAARIGAEAGAELKRAAGDTYFKHLQ